MPITFIKVTSPQEPHSVFCETEGGWEEGKRGEKEGKEGGKQGEGEGKKGGRKGSTGR